MLRATLAAALIATAGATAEPLPESAVPDVFVTRPVTRGDVGRFLRDKDGDPVGSLYAVYGDQAVVWIGFLYQPGSHLVIVPLSEIQPHDGRLDFDVATKSAVEYKPRCADWLCFSKLPPDLSAARAAAQNR